MLFLFLLLMIVFFEQGRELFALPGPLPKIPLLGNDLSTGFRISFKMTMCRKIIKRRYQRGVEREYYK